MATKKKPSDTSRQTKSANGVVAIPVAARTRTPKKASLKPLPKVTPSEPAEKPASGGLVLVIWIGVVVVVLALLTSPYMKRIELKHIEWPHVTLPQINWPEIHITLPDMPNLSGFLSAKSIEPIPEKKVAAPVPEKPAADTKELEALQQQLTQAEGKILQLQSVVQEKDKALQYEIALRGQSLLAQYARLIEHALEKGLPFPWELEQLQHFSDSHMPEAEGLVHALAPYAQGVASVEKLRQDFRTVSDEIYARWKKEDTDSGLRGVFWRMLHQLISIRRVGLVEGTAPDAVIARAEYYLNKDDVVQATRELSAFKGSYASIVQPWMTEAKLRLEALQLIESLHVLAQKMTAAPATTPADLPASPAKTEAP